MGNESGGGKFFVGIISGFGISLDEGLCYVYDGNGVKIYVIMKYRIFLVCYLYYLVYIIFWGYCCD